MRPLGMVAAIEGYTLPLKSHATSVLEYHAGNEGFPNWRPTGNKRAVALAKEHKSLDRRAQSPESMAAAAEKGSKLFRDGIATENKNQCDEAEGKCVEESLHMKLHRAMMHVRKAAIPLDDAQGSACFYTGIQYY